MVYKLTAPEIPNHLTFFLYVSKPNPCIFVVISFFLALFRFLLSFSMFFGFYDYFLKFMSFLHLMSLESLTYGLSTISETSSEAMCVGTLGWIAQMKLFTIVTSTHFSFYSNYNPLAKTD